MQIQLGEDVLEDAVRKGLQATIMNGAIQYILKELTPERLQIFVTDILDGALKDINSWKLKSELQKLAEPLMADFFRRPEIISQLEAAVQEGLQRAMKDVPDMVYSDAKNVIVGAFVDKYDKRSRY